MEAEPVLGAFVDLGHASNLVEAGGSKVFWYIIGEGPRFFRGVIESPIEEDCSRIFGLEYSKELLEEVEEVGVGVVFVGFGESWKGTLNSEGLTVG